MFWALLETHNRLTNGGLDDSGVLVKTCLSEQANRCSIQLSYGRINRRSIMDSARSRSRSEGRSPSCVAVIVGDSTGVRRQRRDYVILQ